MSFVSEFDLVFILFCVLALSILGNN